MSVAVPEREGSIHSASAVSELPVYAARKMTLVRRPLLPSDAAGSSVARMACLPCTDQAEMSAYSYSKLAASRGTTATCH